MAEGAADKTAREGLDQASMLYPSIFEQGAKDVVKIDR